VVHGGRRLVVPSSGRHRIRRGRGAHREAVRGGVGGQRRQTGRVDRRSEAGGLVEVGAHVSGRWAGERIPWRAARHVAARKCQERRHSVVPRR